jgi:hypothetical protein
VCAVFTPTHGRLGVFSKDVLNVVGTMGCFGNTLEYVQSLSWCDDRKIHST